MEVLAQLREELSSRLLDFSRIVTEQEDSRVWAGEYESFTAACERFGNLTKLLRCKLDELKAHEQAVTG